MLGFTPSLFGDKNKLEYHELVEVSPPSIGGVKN
jgi:hypothetical protein